VRILHVDMDAFFASVEQRDNPAIKGLPLVIGGGPPPWGKRKDLVRGFRVADASHASEAARSGRGVVTTCSYEARAYGVHSGMPIAEAWRLCPDAVYLHGSHNRYKTASAGVMNLLSQFSPDFTPIGIDEAFLDVSHCSIPFGSPWRIAHSIQHRMREELDLSCSVGIGETHLMAKMGSKMKKPSGIFEISFKTVEALFAPMPVGKMHGIGPSTTSKLNQMGIYLLGELLAYPDAPMNRKFGPQMTANLKSLARGVGGRVSRPFGYQPTEKSIGNSRTFGRNLKSEEALHAELLDLVESVCKRMRDGNWVGRRVCLQLRSPEFVNRHRQIRLSSDSDQERDIYQAAKYLFHQNWSRGDELRLMGVSVADLKRGGDSKQQLDVFDGENRLKEARLNGVLDDLKNQMGKNCVRRCDAMMRGHWRQEAEKDQD
jgi:DNA polymerase IV